MIGAAIAKAPQVAQERASLSEHGARGSESPMQMKSSHCRACGSGELTLVHDFGPQPLAGYFPLVPEREEPAARYPLDLTQCAHCGLLQVTNLPPIEAVFHADYRYSSSTVPDLVRHFAEYADWLAAHVPGTPPVLEFGCNDGVLLAQLGQRGLACTGVDASDNMAALARAKGLDVRTGFLTPALVDREGLAGLFGLVTCSNVFAHIPDLATTLEAVRRLLRPDGHFAVEVHDGRILAEEAQFDTIYHEHLTYFTAGTLPSLLERNGFRCVAVEHTGMHGGGLRMLAQRTPDRGSASASARPAMIDGSVFSESIARCRADLADLVARYGPLDGYGAAGRAQMFVNIVGGGAQFAQVFDDSPFRQGRFVVGTDIPIRAWNGDGGRCCAILAWNYAPSIAARLRGHYERVVTLLPALRGW